MLADGVGGSRGYTVIVVHDSVRYCASLQLLQHNQESGSR
jgi:hypothetical protein